MSFGTYLKKEVYAKFVDVSGDGWLLDDSPFCDYRVGCSLCEQGKATGYTTNIGKLMRTHKDDWFLLNDIEIDDCNPETPFYRFWETSNPKVIQTVYNLFINYGNASCKIMEQVSFDDSDSCGITSVFRNRDDTVLVPSKIKTIHLCDACFKMLVTLKKLKMSDFVLTNSMKYFFNFVVSFYLSDAIIFKDPDDKYIFSDKMDPSEVKMHSWFSLH